jgi:hypothetical protein
VTTRELIVLIQKKASQFTPAELLTILDLVQKRVLSRVTAQRTVIDEATGMPPLLATTDQIYTYDCPANCLRTISVFSEQIRYYSRVQYDGIFKSYNYRGTEYYGLPIKSTDAVFGVAAKLTFVGYNPGTTTARYYHEYLFKPPDLTAQTVNLVIPEEHHLELVNGVLAWIRNERYGDVSEWNKWWKTDGMQIISELNSGAQPYLGFTPTRMEYRHYSNAIYGNWFT